MRRLIGLLGLRRIVMNEDSDIYIVCSRCMVKISGPTSEAVNTAFRGHEKEAHGYMTGQEWYIKFEKRLLEVPEYKDVHVPGVALLVESEVLEAARKVAELEGGDE